MMSHPRTYHVIAIDGVAGFHVVCRPTAHPDWLRILATFTGRDRAESYCECEQDIDDDTESTWADTREPPPPIPAPSDPLRPWLHIRDMDRLQIAWLSTALHTAGPPPMPVHTPTETAGNIPEIIPTPAAPSPAEADGGSIVAAQTAVEPPASVRSGNNTGPVGRGEHDDMIRDLWDENVSIRDMAKMVGCAKGTLETRVKDLALPARPHMVGGAPAHKASRPETEPSPSLKTRNPIGDFDNWLTVPQARVWKALCVMQGETSDFPGVTPLAQAAGVPKGSIGAHLSALERKRVIASIGSIGHPSYIINHPFGEGGYRIEDDYDGAGEPTKVAGEKRREPEAPTVSTVAANIAAAKHLPPDVPATTGIKHANQAEAGETPTTFAKPLQRRCEACRSLFVTKKVEQTVCIDCERRGVRPQQPVASSGIGGSLA